MQTIKKLFPIDLFDVEGMQTYLSDMAKQGFFFQKFLYINGIMAIYEIREPQNIQYFLEPVLSNEMRPDSHKIKAYREASWEYLCYYYGGNSVYFQIYTAKPNTPLPVQSDEVYLKRKFQSMLSKMKRTNQLLCMIWLVCCMIILSSTLLIPYPIVQIVQYGVLMKILYAFILLYALIELLNNQKRTRVIAQYLQPKSINRPIFFAKNYYACMRIVTILLFSFIASGHNIATMFVPTSVADTKYADVFPILSLQNTEHYYRLNIENTDAYSQTEFANIFSFTQTTVSENQSNDYQPTLFTRVYDFHQTFLLDDFFDSLLLSQGYTNQADELYYHQIIEDSRFDNIYLLQTDSSQQLFIKTGTFVIHFIYSGHEDLTMFLDVIYENINQNLFLTS